MILACVFMIAFSTGACAGKNKMQVSSIEDETVQATAESDSKNGEISDDQTLECRRIATTGSRFKKKTCKTKAQWAWESGARNRQAEKLKKKTARSFSTAVPAANDGGSFPGAGVPR